jgi:hypothetical protein
MKRLRSGQAAALLLMALVTGISLADSASAQVDVHRYVRWKRNGQLDYRRLLQRYEAVSSFSFDGKRYGFPYAGWGGLRQPRYLVRSMPNGVYLEGPFYIGSPYDVGYFGF